MKDFQAATRAEMDLQQTSWMRDVGGLHVIGQVPGEQQELAGAVHDELRKNLLSNVVRQYRETGFLWENYRDGSGRGQGSHPFTGWTALVVLIAGEAYFDI